MKPPPPLWAHQALGVMRATPQHNFAFFYEMGTGKTRTIIETLWQKFSESKKVGKVLIFTPPAVIEQFRLEWFKYTTIPKNLVVSLRGSQKKRLKNFLALSQDQRIFITNYEALNMKDLYQAFTDWAPEFLVWDESHKLKSPSAERSKLANTLSNPYNKKEKKALPKPHTYILTGTPVLNTPMDLFQQCKVLDGGATFGDNFFGFRDKYFRDRNALMPRHKHFPDWQPRTKHRDGFDGIGEINEKLQMISMRVKKEECLDLPPEVDVVIKTEMLPEQARCYHEMRTELITYLNSQACVATLALTKALRLMQIASGFVTVEGDGGPKTIPLGETPKMDALKELLEEICADPKNKVIVWTVWRETYRHIGEACAALKLGYVEVHGEISESKKRANIDSFRSDSTCRVFVAHPRSGGVGLNLVEAGYSIRYSRTFSLEDYLQSRARNHRGGSLEAGHKSITHYELVTEGTIEPSILQKLANKIDVSESLLSNLISALKDNPED